MDKILSMKGGIYYILAAVLLLFWTVGYLILNIGGAFHLIFLLAVLVILLKLTRDNTF